MRCGCAAQTRALLALALGLTANALSFTNVFPYAPFMVKFFGLTDDDRELGFYAGFFMTATQVGALLSSVFWGVMSDRWGKRVVIMIGLGSCTLPQLLFGLATSMPVALALRLLMGLLNGLIGAAKALAPELVAPTEQAAAMSMIAATWGLGNLAGPAIGGLLSQYDACQEGNSDRCPPYPFLMPNLLCAALAVLGLIAVRGLLPDDRKPTAAPPRGAALGAVAPEGSDAQRDRVALRGSLRLSLIHI